jgi:hypothetical protein
MIWFKRIRIERGRGHRQQRNKAMKHAALLLKSLAVFLLVQKQTPAADSTTAPLPAACPVELPFEKVLPGEITDYDVMRAYSGRGREYLLDTIILPAEGLVLECTGGRSGAKDKPWLMLRNKNSGRGITV